MEVQDWITAVVAFLAGGGLGTSGVLLLQWLVGRFDPDDRRAKEQARELAGLRNELRELDGQLSNVDARLDFTEKLLGGALSVPPAPARLRERGRRSTGDGSASEEAPDPEAEGPDRLSTDP